MIHFAAYRIVNNQPQHLFYSSTAIFFIFDDR